ncbi:hypothetical protein AWB68_04265 [Caballeronia choica]|uniref:Uncharacterized protein n=1 Tax=Caballeronia choica TaxID=326476 RepID=A0A158JTV2_9BURK|nr:DUF6065 family protein [Caballeronia choica]SAL72374.1 hypothetical protein AWB68_04265 [Caballeronia choica]
MELLAYRHGFPFDMKLVRSSVDRVWMDATSQRYAYRCLPMVLANQLGWNILNDNAFRALWRGGDLAEDVIFEPELPSPSSVISHFGHGIITFMLPFLFRVPAGFQLLLRGPANLPKDAIQSLEGLVEADWAVATATMNWKFTRSDIWVTFERAEPICTIVPLQVAVLEAMTPRESHILDDPILKTRYEAWAASREAFHNDLKSLRPEVIKAGWQRHYFQGTSPGADGVPCINASEHRTRIALKEFEKIRDQGTASPVQAVD